MAKLPKWHPFLPNGLQRHATPPRTTQRFPSPEPVQEADPVKGARATKHISCVRAVDLPIAGPQLATSSSAPATIRQSCSRRSCSQPLPTRLERWCEEQRRCPSPGLQRHATPPRTTQRFPSPEPAQETDPVKGARATKHISCVRAVDLPIAGPQLATSSSAPATIYGRRSCSQPLAISPKNRCDERIPWIPRGASAIGVHLCHRRSDSPGASSKTHSKNAYLEYFRHRCLMPRGEPEVKASEEASPDCDPSGRLIDLAHQATSGDSPETPKGLQETCLSSKPPELSAMPDTLPPSSPMHFLPLSTDQSASLPLTSHPMNEEVNPPPQPHPPKVRSTQRKPTLLSSSSCSQVAGKQPNQSGVKLKVWTKSVNHRIPRSGSTTRKKTGNQPTRHDIHGSFRHLPEKHAEAKASTIGASSPSSISKFPSPRPRKVIGVGVSQKQYNTFAKGVSTHSSTEHLVISCTEEHGVNSRPGSRRVSCAISREATSSFVSQASTVWVPCCERDYPPMRHFVVEPGRATVEGERANRHLPSQALPKLSDAIHKIINMRKILRMFSKPLSAPIAETGTS